MTWHKNGMKQEGHGIKMTCRRTVLTAHSALFTHLLTTKQRLRYLVFAEGLIYHTALCSIHLFVDCLGNHFMKNRYIDIDGAVFSFRFCGI